MSLPKDKAWFPAKQYGYGWGLPSRWQGCVALAIYIMATLASTVLLLGAPPNWVAFAICTLVLTAAMIALVVWKGERPRWRWGDPD